MSAFLVRMLNILLLLGIVISIARGDFGTAGLLFLGLAATVLVAGVRLPGVK